MGTNLFEFANPRYLQGISDEPRQILQPITGYAYEPLLSLEEACEPLLTIVPNLPAHIWVAKQNSKKPADDLTQDESAAIRLYTMEWDSTPDDPFGSLYYHLNRTLQLIDRTKLRPWFRYLKLFLTALAKLPAAPQQTVWRGVRKDHSADYPPGSEATWWAFSSCTTSLSVLESDLYLGNTGTRTLFSIETFNARTVRDHSHFTAEDEILLLPGTFFEVKSRLNPAPDLYIIHLSQKIPPHALLEAPFEGAELLPLYEPEPRKMSTVQIEDTKIHIPRSTPWFKRKEVLIGLAILLALIIAGIILGAVLGTRKHNTSGSPALATVNSTLTASTTPVATATTTIGMVGLLGSTPSPVSVSNAFYSFDGNILDLYSNHNGQLIGGPVSYTLGYVATGQAIVFNQTNPTWINITNTFNITTSSLTVEAFVMLLNTPLTATIIQLSSDFKMGLIDGVLSMTLGSNVNVTGKSVLSTEQWHHLCFSYDAQNQMAIVYIDGTADGSQSGLTSGISRNSNSTSIATIGIGLHGVIDRLSVSFTRKASDVILWDATVAAYYPMDTDWNRDWGPNGLNASVTNTISVPGWHGNALNFNNSGSYFQAVGFTALSVARQAFSLAMWVRAESSPGTFLTIANPSICLLTLSLRSGDNKLIAYLPNATNAGTPETVVGPVMPLGQWVQVTFTWSFVNQAKLYTSGFLQGSDANAVKLNNDHNGKIISPMIITLGTSTGTASCQAADGVNSTQGFKVSVDELYVFARELSISEIGQLTATSL